MYSIGADSSEMQEAIWSSVAEEVRRRTERLVNGMMDMERMVFLGVAPYERGGARRGRRNGFDERVLDSRWGPLRLRIPKVRQSAERFRPQALRAYQRRQRALDQLALEWVACGMSTRAVSEQLYRAFGALVSAGTISALVAEMDAELAAFRERRFERGYLCVFFDGKHGKVACPAGRRGRGRARAGVLLLAWGIRHDGSEELIDFCVASDESEASWDGFLRSLRDRGLVEVNRWAERLERIISDGDSGLEAALALNYPETPHQTCIFHKVKNLLGISRTSPPRARSRAKRVPFSRRPRGRKPSPGPRLGANAGNPTNRSPSATSGAIWTRCSSSTGQATSYATA